MKKLEIIKADLTNSIHAEAVLKLTDLYARDPMGKKSPLTDEVKSTLIEKLREFPCSLNFIAFMDSEAAGIANCVFSFSTFNASRVLNIHDLAVNPKFRGNGIGSALLGAVEKEAKKENCCKITLEVREDNRALKLYERSGFSNDTPKMFFMEKYLD